MNISIFIFTYDGFDVMFWIMKQYSDLQEKFEV